MNRTRFLDHLVLLLGVAFMVGPIIIAFLTSTHDPYEIHMKGLMASWGNDFVQTYDKVLFEKAYGYIKQYY